MYLKSLHVVGFKSFADRTTLEFHPGVTAIVGPNGCGKSNVLDSIRWVLGEQSAKALRGGEMKDVIFSGTDSRPPLGMAEVSLTFGDCEQDLGVEYNEVTITRRVFRDGASEYELNKTPCRLRDIHQLFMDTGVGRSAYSIMEQGKIDLILSSRPEDRRAIFEEAAGITKYKSQKKEALRKLENTEANLIRLADIIREVKRQIGSLQRQAGKARRYQASFAELAVLEQRLGRHHFDTYSETIARLQAEVDGTRQRQEELDRDVAAQEGELASSRAALAVIETELVRLRDEQSTLRNALERVAARPPARHHQSRARRGIHRPARPGAAGDRRHGGKDPRR
jgi:chromosome segregation protein